MSKGMTESAGRARLIAQILVFKPWNPETDDAHQVSTNYLQCPICAAYNHEPHDDDCALGAAVKLADALAREEPHAENCRAEMKYSDGSRIFPMADCNCRTALAGQEEAPQPNLGVDTPWPLRDVLLKLVEAMDHLLMAHDCDHFGWEQINAARDAARRYANQLAKAEEDAPAPPRCTCEIDRHDFDCPIHGEPRVKPDIAALKALPDEF